MPDTDGHSAAAGPQAAPSPAGRGGTAPPEREPVMQQVLDNPFLLLFLGITIPTVLYLVWGIMEIASVPVHP